LIIWSHNAIYATLKIFIKGAPDASTAQSQPSQPVPTSQRRPLQREGAVYILSPAEQALADAMLRSSPPPEQVLGKRPHEEDDEEDPGRDTEPDEGTSTSAQAQSLVPSLGNITGTTLRYATYKKLRAEQRDELEAFLQESALGRQAKLFVCLLSVENKIDTFRSAAPPYQVSDGLKTNINNYSVAVLLSVNISAYKGDIPRNHILNILKRYRFDMPPGIEHDYANWEKITTAVSYSLTQTRARVKKLVRDSIVQDTNVFALAQVIVHGTPCRPTVQLCSRVALMRAVHQECKGSEKYWNLIDQRLALVRRLAGTDAGKASKIFRAILKTDRETYGVGEDYVIADLVADDWQQRVDDVVSGI
jgi:hypothetical protein